MSQPVQPNQSTQLVHFKETTQKQQPHFEETGPARPNEQQQRSQSPEHEISTSTRYDKDDGKDIKRKMGRNEKATQPGVAALLFFAQPSSVVVGVYQQPHLSTKCVTANRPCPKKRSRSRSRCDEDGCRETGEGGLTGRQGDTSQEGCSSSMAAQHTPRR